MKLKVILPDGRRVGTGWLPSLPDLRDYTECHPKLAKPLHKLRVDDAAPLPDKADLREWCSPVQDQGELGSCTAQAAAGIIAVHNHPSGICQPSPEDELLTMNIQEAGKTMGVKIIDHIIVSRSSHYSFVAEGKL